MELGRNGAFYSSLLVLSQFFLFVYTIVLGCYMFRVFMLVVVIVVNVLTIIPLVFSG